MADNTQLDLMQENNSDTRPDNVDKMWSAPSMNSQEKMLGVQEEEDMQFFSFNPEPQTETVEDEWSPSSLNQEEELGEQLGEQQQEDVRFFSLNTARPKETNSESDPSSKIIN